MMQPSRYLSKWFTSKRNKDFATALFALNQAGSFEQLQVFRHRVQSGVEGLCDIQETSRSVGQLPNDGAASRVRNGDEDVRQLIHAYITP